MRESRDDCCANPFWMCGLKFVKWGLGFFLFGLLVGFGVLIHYLVGSRWNTGDRFLSNITLWFGSPLSLSASYLQLGGLGMVALGTAKLWLAKLWRTDDDRMDPHHTHGQGSLNLCNLGLIALFLTGYIGYFIIDGIWPGFYYAPITNAKNLWLIIQGLSILCFFIGLLNAFCCVCKCCKRCDIRR